MFKKLCEKHWKDRGLHDDKKIKGDVKKELRRKTKLALRKEEFNGGEA